MVLIFSVMMLVSFLLFYSFASRTSEEGANAFTESRFKNMSTSIERDLEQEFDMMKIALRELTDNFTFMSALNQIVRDDSEDQKMAQAAERTALQQLVESPLVDMYYRATFYNRDGAFLTSSTSKDSSLIPRSEEAKALFSSVSWLDEADRSKEVVIMPTSRDIFSRDPDDEVYGITAVARYNGNPIGYISIVNRLQNLDVLMDYTDEPGICVEAVYDNGSQIGRAHV